MSTRRNRFVSAVLVACCTVGAGSANAQDMLAELDADFGDLSLEDLMNIEVVTVSRKAEPIGQAAAAIHVVTGDAIVRSGARNLAEALRLVPGVHVARSSSHSYSVSIRGFASTSSDKLEVLIDGRSAYTPLFSGVFWDTFDTYLPDIERIEVVRGPGATLWGANAVNGVINIVTKKASDTTKTAVTLGVGTERRGALSIRGGHDFGDAAVRVYAKSFELDSSEQANGDDAIDGQRFSQAGFRADMSLADGGSVMLTGDAFGARSTATGVGGPPIEADADGANLNFSWRRPLSEDSGISVSLWGEQTRRLSPGLFAEDRTTIDVGTQYNTKLGERHDVIIGAGYRRSSDKTGAPPDVIIFEPQNRVVERSNVYIMDRISLGERATLSIGSKFENNDFTGDEVQPGVRFGYRISDNGFLWASVAQAVRTPNRLDHDVAIFCSAGLVTFGLCDAADLNQSLRIGNQDFDSEKVLAWEMGGRRVFGNLSVDLALFYNDYSDLRSTEALPLPFGSFENRHEGEGVGGELTLTAQVAKHWTLQAWYSYLDLDITAEPGSTDTTTASSVEGASPEHQAGMINRWSPSARWSLDGNLRYVSRLETGQVPSYVEADATLIRRFGDSIELRLIGRNLLDSAHREFGAAGDGSGTYLERAVLLEGHLRW